MNHVQEIMELSQQYGLFSALLVLIIVVSTMIFKHAFSPIWKKFLDKPKTRVLILIMSATIAIISLIGICKIVFLPRMAPIIVVNPASGSTTNDVTIKICSFNGIDHGRYQWDNNPSVKFTDTSVKALVPDTVGIHALYVYVYDVRGNYSNGDLISDGTDIRAWKKYIYTHTIP